MPTTRFMSRWVALGALTLTIATACAIDGGADEPAEEDIFASAPGLVAAYAFDEGSGSSAADATGGGNTGTLSNATWSSSGRFGRALSCNGTSSWVTVADRASLDLTNRMTLEAWVRPTVSTGWRTVLTKEQPGNIVYGLFSSSDTNQPAGIVAFSPTQSITRGPQLPVNTWTHLATTYDGTWLRLYINGARVARLAVAGTMPNSSGALRICGNSVWPEWFSGLVDEVRVYNRALTGAEIRADMVTPIGGGTPPTDTTPPSAPGNVAASGPTQSSVTLGWSASSDNVGVAGYDLFRNGTSVGGVTSTSYMFTGLSCGTSYTLGVRARDAAGNVSATSTLSASTSACGGGGYTVTFSGTVSASTFTQQVNAAPAGPITVGPASGQSSFTVTGDVTLTRANVAISRAFFTDVEFASSAGGSSLSDGRARAVHISGADDITLQGNVFDGQCVIGQNFIMPSPAGNGVKNFRILDNTFRNYHVCADESVHSEALFIGALSEGLIDGNEFYDNGTTGHIFFTWWGGTAGVDHPRNICVRGNLFVRSLNGYYHIQNRSEIPDSANIDIEPEPSNTRGASIPGFDTVLAMDFERPCQ